MKKTTTSTNFNHLESLENENLKIPETLEEQRDYYLNLYQKWQKWQKNEEMKIKNKKLLQLIQKVDFEQWKKNLEEKKFNTSLFCKLAENDYEIEKILIFSTVYDGFISLDEIEVFFRDSTSNFIVIADFTLSKPILIIDSLYFNHENDCLYFSEVDGQLSLIIKSYSKLEVEFENCDFSHITLENFDLRYFSVETMEYLNKMEGENKLTLINCKEWELPVLRESFETAEIGKKIWEREIILDEKNKPLKTLLHKHLAFFADFVELTEGKKVQIRITSEVNIILVEIFSFNGATSELIERKYYEFIGYSLSDEHDTSRINFNEKIGIVDRIKNEGAIGFAKGIFFGEKKHIEETEKLNFRLIDLANNLIEKLPNYQQNSSNIYFTNSNNQSNSNPISNYNLNDSLNNNSGNINLGENNRIIDKKIVEIIGKNQDLELQKVLEEIKNLKDKILESEQISNENKEDSLDAIKIIVENSENKENPQNHKLIRNAAKTIFPIVGNFGLGLITNLGWEMIKSYFGIKF